MPKRTSDATYRKARQELLKDKPYCHWCKKRLATTADHLIEHDRGGSDTIDNLVPACQTCNSQRGANYLAAKKAQRRHNIGIVKQNTRQRACNNCQRLFTPKDWRNQGKYCSQQCHWDARKKATTVDVVELKCSVCNTSILTETKNGKTTNRKTCGSDRCVKARNAIRSRERYDARKRRQSKFGTLTEPQATTIDQRIEGGPQMRDAFLNENQQLPPRPSLSLSLIHI